MPVSRRNRPSGGISPVISLLCAGAIVAPCIVSGAADTPQRPKSPLTDKTIPIRPTIPSADRHQPGKVFLERADRLWMDERIDSDYQVLTGNVEFRRGDMFMFCDSAHFYDKEGSFQAFGNVRMEQGDTLFVYADELMYDGPTELATFYGGGSTGPVRLINRDVQLTTDLFHYDLAQNLGYYDAQGQITDAENRLASVYGQYSPDTKEAEFRIDVVLNDLKEEDFRMTTSRLLYNTDTHMARLVSPTVIVTDSATVYSDRGWYDTERSLSELYDRSRVVSNGGNTITGDTLFYDNKTGFGEAFGNVELTDSARNSAIHGMYGCYYQALDSAFVTGRAMALEYSRKDTLYLHGDTIRAFRLPGPDSMHVVTAFRKVRFWRIDLAGLCDSLVFQQSDSIMYMYRHPIVWNEQRQVFGGLITVHFNDSTADWARLPDYGFVAEHVDEEFYNQLSGKEIVARFTGGALTELDVNGNVETIMLPEEKDSTYNKIVATESSFLRAQFADNKLTRLLMWPEVTGTVTPLYLSKRSAAYLNGFKWYDALRPKSKEDIFIVPPEMEALLKEPDPSARRRVTR